MLRRALASIAVATSGSTQMLVVDSASTTAQTRDAALAAGVDYVRSDIKGLSIARNVGFRATDRSIIVYTDDDCEAVAGWIDTLLVHFADPAVGAVTGRLLDHTLIGAETEPAPATVFTTVDGGLDAGHGAIMAFRREVLEEVDGFDEVLGAGRRLAGAEDLDIFCRIIDAGHVIVHEPRSVVHHMNSREGVAYTELHRGYGLGLGGMSMKWIRLRTSVGLSLTTKLIGRTVWRTIRNPRDRRRRRADLALLGGMVSGLFRTIRVPLTGTRFVDVRPPSPITIGGEHAESA